MAGRALVLSGGGANGAFQVGAERYARLEKGYTWDLIAGVSVGALNGSMLAMHKYDRLLEIWETSSNDKIYTGKLNVWAVIRMVFGARSALGNKPLQRLIEDEYDRSAFQTEVRVGAVSLRSGRYEVFKEDDPEFPTAILASTSIPVYWEPVQMRPPYVDMVDGGLRNISPLGDVLDSDPSEVVIINCSPQEPTPPERPLKGVLEIATRSLDIALNEIFVTDLREFLRINMNVKQAGEGVLKDENGRPYEYYESKIIEPLAPLGDSLDFSAAASRRRIEAGWEAAKRVLG
jgi:NTE family protein